MSECVGCDHPLWAPQSQDTGRCSRCNNTPAIYPNETGHLDRYIERTQG